MGHISYQTDVGESVEHSDIHVEYDTEAELFVFEVPAAGSDRLRYVPRERVFTVELEAPGEPEESVPDRGFGRMTG